MRGGDEVDTTDGLADLDGLAGERDVVAAEELARDFDAAAAGKVDVAMPSNSVGCDRAAAGLDHTGGQHGLRSDSCGGGKVHAAGRSEHDAATGGISGGKVDAGDQDGRTDAAAIDRQIACGEDLIGDSDVSGNADIAMARDAVGGEIRGLCREITGRKDRSSGDIAGGRQVHAASAIACNRRGRTQHDIAARCIGGSKVDTGNQNGCGNATAVYRQIACGQDLIVHIDIAGDTGCGDRHIAVTGDAVCREIGRLRRDIARRQDRAGSGVAGYGEVRVAGAGKLDIATAGVGCRKIDAGNEKAGIEAVCIDREIAGRQHLAADVNATACASAAGLQGGVAMGGQTVRLEIGAVGGEIAGRQQRADGDIACGDQRNVTAYCLDDVAIGGRCSGKVDTGDDGAGRYALARNGNIVTAENLAAHIYAAGSRAGKSDVLMACDRSCGDGRAADIDGAGCL